MSARCRSCGAPIVWATTAKGKAAIFDATPRADVESGYRILQGFATHTKQNSLFPEALFVSHWATCPNAKQHRANAERAADVAAELNRAAIARATRPRAQISCVNSLQAAERFFLSNSDMAVKAIGPDGVEKVLTCYPDAVEFFRE